MCWYWNEAGWTVARWSLSRGLTSHGWNAEHGRQAEVMPKDIAHTAHSFCASFHEGEALAQSQTDALIAASWAERGCPGSHQTAYQDISPWVTAIDARQMIFATSAKHRSFRNLFLLNRFLKSLSIGRVFPWYHCRILGFFPCIRSEQSGFSRVCFIPLISIVGFFPYVQKYCFVTLPNDRSSPCSLRIAHATILRTARGKY